MFSTSLPSLVLYRKLQKRGTYFKIQINYYNVVYCTVHLLFQISFNMQTAEKNIYFFLRCQLLKVASRVLYYCDATGQRCQSANLNRIKLLFLNEETGRAIKNQIKKTRIKNIRFPPQDQSDS